jgi:hypothetical protein
MGARIFCSRPLSCFRTRAPRVDCWCIAPRAARPTSDQSTICVGGEGWYNQSRSGNIELSDDFDSMTKP